LVTKDVSCKDKGNDRREKQEIVHKSVTEEKPTKIRHNEGKTSEMLIAVPK